MLCGTDQMSFFASYLRHLLMLLDLRAEVVASPSQENLAKLGRVNDKTVMVGFSAGRPHPLVVRAMKLARNRHAATIAIADATQRIATVNGAHAGALSLVRITGTDGAEAGQTYASRSVDTTDPVETADDGTTEDGSP